MKITLVALTVAVAWLLLGVVAAQNTHHSSIIFSPERSSRGTHQHHKGSSKPSITPVDTSILDHGVLGNKLPGEWRPFASTSPWNAVVPAAARIHPDSQLIMRTLVGEAPHLRFTRKYAIPVWVVKSDEVQLVKVRGENIFDTWDRSQRGWSDVGAPITPHMWGEQTGDGHLSVVDLNKNTAWELSRFRRLEDGTPACSTFNLWDLNGEGFAQPNGRRWYARGGRGSGFPEIAGLLRPEEIEAGEIRHALVFTFSKNRRAEGGGQMFVPPACRSDGKESGRQYPIEGMRLQLDPSLTDKDFERWGLGPAARVVARALQRYGMFDGDNGGAMALQAQLLAPSAQENYERWEAKFPGLFRDIEKIPTEHFYVLYTGEAIVK